MVSDQQHLSLLMPFISGFDWRMLTKTTVLPFDLLPLLCCFILDVIIFAVVIWDFFFLRWKKARQEGGYHAEMTYCRRNFLNRTSLLTLEVN